LAIDFKLNKKEIPCCHGNREDIFWFSAIYGCWNNAKCLFIISMKFSIDRIPCLKFEFWDFGRIMAVGHWTKSQNRDSRVFSSSPRNFWSIEHNHALYWNLGLWPDWGVGHRRRWPWAQYTKYSWCWDLSKKPFTCSILTAGTQVILRKAYFLRRGSWLRPESWTPRPRIQNPRPYY
jgi:hypothetical protein